MPFAAVALAFTIANAAPELRSIAGGVEYAELDGFHVVRVDPTKAQLAAATAKDDSEGMRNKTAAQWAQAKRFSVVMNAGMFVIEDMSTHVGYFRVGKRVDQKAWKSTYKSVLAIGAHGKGSATTIADCPDDGACPRFDDAARYDVVAQNLRLIGNGKGVWQENGKRWSEAAIALDDKGRVLFIFSRAGLSMKTWNDRVLGLGLGVIRAMHAEGGPEASLSIRSPSLNLDLCGSFETGFNENDDNKSQWPIPNVIGVAAAAQ